MLTLTCESTHTHELSFARSLKTHIIASDAAGSASSMIGFGTVVGFSVVFSTCTIHCNLSIYYVNINTMKLRKFYLRYYPPGTTIVVMVVVMTGIILEFEDKQGDHIEPEIIQRCFDMLSLCPEYGKMMVMVVTCSTDIEALLDDLYAEEPAIPKSKRSHMRNLIMSTHCTVVVIVMMIELIEKLKPKPSDEHASYYLFKKMKPHDKGITCISFNKSGDR